MLGTPLKSDAWDLFIMYILVRNGRSMKPFFGGEWIFHLPRYGLAKLEARLGDIFHLE